VSTTELITSVPLVRTPQSWPLAATAGSAMVVLAALDFAGAIAAKEWSTSGSPRWLAAGIVSFLLLFYVYASSLRYAELAMVTMGWVVLLQVGLLVLDRLRYDVDLPTGKWVAVVAILALQAYLLMPSSTWAGAA
jgi:hypothetical protein